MAEVVVEHGYIDLVNVRFGFLDGAGGDDVVALLFQDGRAQEKIFFAIVEQQNSNRLLFAYRLTAFQKPEFAAVVHLSLS